MIFVSQILATLSTNSLIPPASGENFIYFVNVKYGSTVVCSNIVGRLEGSVYKFYGVEENVKAYMELHGIAFAEFEFDIYRKWEGYDPVNTSSNLYEVLYDAYKYNGTAASIVNNHFMTRRKEVWTHSSQAYMARWAGGTVGDTFTIVKYKKDGTTSTQTVEVTSKSGAVAIGGNSDLIYCYAKYGNRELTVYTLDAPKYLMFEFRNQFNSKEYLTLVATIKSSPSTEYETASQGRKTRKYDIEHKLEITIKTSGLFPGQEDALLEMCRSREVKFVRSDLGIVHWSEVLIKDYKLEKSDAPNTPVTAEITFEPADYDELTLTV